MNTFFLGMLAGISIFGVVILLVLSFKMTQEIAMIHRIVQILGLKINKIEKVTQTTMEAAEGFVDALQSSAEQMIQQQQSHQESPDQFEDLRESFEEGIRKFEEEEGEEDEDNWKKKK